MDTDTAPDLPSPRSTADRLRDRVAAVIAGTVALVTALKLWDHLGPNSAEIALAVENLALMIAALVFTALGQNRDQTVRIRQKVAVRKAYRAGLYQPIPSADGRDTVEDAERDTNPIGLGGGGVVVALLGLASLLLGSACDPGRSVAPGLTQVLARVDVTRVLECRVHLPDWGAVARCVGAEAATQGLRIAYEQALQAIDRVPNPTAGAADLEPGTEERLASEVDASLEELAQEIAATHAAGGDTLDP